MRSASSAVRLLTNLLSWLQPVLRAPNGSALGPNLQASPSLAKTLKCYNCPSELASCQTIRCPPAIATVLVIALLCLIKELPLRLHLAQASQLCQES